MSIRIMGALWGARLEPRTFLVLLAMADHADHEGGNIHPGIDLLMEKTSSSRAAVYRALADLKSTGILIPESNATGGRGKRVSYRIDLDAVPRGDTPVENSPTGERVSGHLNSPTGETKTLPQVRHKLSHGCEKNGATPFKEPSIEPSVEPLTSVDVARDAIRDAAMQRKELFDGYCQGVGILPNSAEYVRRFNFASADLPAPVLTTETPVRLEAIGRYLLNRYAEGGIRKTPTLAQVIEAGAEYDRLHPNGTAAAAATPADFAGRNLSIDDLRRLSDSLKGAHHDQGSSGRSAHSRQVGISAGNRQR
jgi:hypothetical protein